MPYGGPEVLRALTSQWSEADVAVLITEPDPLAEPGPRIVFVNDAFTQITGYSLEECVGRSPRFLQGPATEPAARAQFREACAQQRPVTVTVTNYRRDGSPFPFEMTMTPVRDGHNELVAFLTVQQDVTMRDRAAAAARCLASDEWRDATVGVLLAARRLRHAQRRRLAAELHENVVQHLAATRLQMWPLESSDEVARLPAASAAVRTVSAELTDLVHSVSRLADAIDPDVLAGDLSAALDGLAESLSRETGVPVAVSVSAACFGGGWHRVFRVVEEALLATLLLGASRLAVSVSLDAGTRCVSVTASGLSGRPQAVGQLRQVLATLVVDAELVRLDCDGDLVAELALT